MKVEAKVEAMDEKLDEHGEILRGIGESFNPLMGVLQALTDWAIVFGYFMTFVRWCWGPVGRKVIVFLILLWYYLKTGDWQTMVKTLFT